MNGTLNKFRKRNIQTNFPHLVLVIFVVAVSVCLIMGLFISHLTLTQSVERFYANSNLPNLWIECSEISSEDEDFYSKYVYTKRYSFQSEITISSKKFDAKFLVSDGEVSSPYLVEGEKGNGCYISSKFIDEYNIGINYSTIYFDYTIDGVTKRLHFKVLGSLALAEELAVSDECVIFIDEKYFSEELNVHFSDVLGEADFVDYNQILITSNISQTDIDDISNYYANNSSSQLNSILTRGDIKSFQMVSDEIRISKLMLFIFPIMFVLVSVLVIVSSIVDMVTREGYNIGLLKSFGVPNRKILSNYCGYGVFVCLIGAILGMLISPLLIPNMTFETYDIILNLPQDEVKMVIPVWLIISIIFSVILIGYFSAFFVCIGWISKTPKECMSGYRKIKPARNRLKSAGNVGSAFKSMRNNPARTTMGVVGITGCLLLSLIGFGVNELGGLFQNNGTKTLETYSFVFQIFSVAILVLTIIILFVQIFREKSKEMAMLRIHGEPYLKIWISLLLEMVLIAVISYVVAGMLCQPIFILLLRLFGIKSIFLIDFISFLKTFLMLAGFILIISLFALIKVYKLNLSDATKLSE